MIGDHQELNRENTSGGSSSEAACREMHVEAICSSNFKKSLNKNKFEQDASSQHTQAERGFNNPRLPLWQF